MCCCLSVQLRKKTTLTMASKPPPVIPRKTKPHGNKESKLNRNTIGGCIDIPVNWNYSQAISLPEFVEKYNDKLPLSIQVQTGYLGESSHVTLSAFDRLNIHFVKCSTVVNVKVLSGNFTIPINSALEFSLLYNPNDNVNEAFKGFTFKTVADIFRAKIQPMFVCCMKSWRNDKVSIRDRELLIIKGKCASQKTSSMQEVAMVYSVTSSKEMILSLDCEGHFTTNPNYLHLYLSEYILHVSNLFPSDVYIYTQKPDVRTHVDGMPQHFTNSVITLMGTSTETTLLASSALPGFNDTVMEIPIDIPEVKIAVSESTDMQQAKQLYENSCHVLQSYNPRNVQYMKDAMTDEKYTIQSELYSGIRQGYEADGIQLNKEYEYIDSAKLLRPPMPHPSASYRKSLPISFNSSTEVDRGEKRIENIILTHPATNVELDPRTPDDSDSPATISVKRTDQMMPDYNAIIEELKNSIQIMQKKVERIDGIETQLKKLSLMLINVQDAIGIKDTENQDKDIIAERNRQYLSKLTSSEVITIIHVLQ